MANSIAVVDESSASVKNDASVKQYAAVLGIDPLVCCIPDAVVHVQTDEPAKEQVVVQFFHQQSLAAHAVEHFWPTMRFDSFASNSLAAGLF